LRKSNEASSNPILVTGATGRHGGTSAHVVAALLEAGRSVRVFARSESVRTKSLASLGAEIAFGDFNDRKSLVRALDGVDTATFTYPVNSGIVPAAATFASAAREHEVPLRTIVMSMAVAHPESPSHLGRAQWLAEEVLAWSGLNLCVLRIAALFFENIASLHAASIEQKSAFSNCFGNAEVPWISGLDAARLMVSAVLHPDFFAGRSIHYPPGAQLLSHSKLADILASELGRPIRFDPVSQEQWAAELAETACREPDGVISVDMAKHISAVGAALAGTGKGPIRAPDSAELQRLTGARPVLFAEFVRQNRHLFDQRDVHSP
jgi:uncharacterized protein YbjT (DUF2867 family)